MNLEATRKLLSYDPEDVAPRTLLKDILYASIELLSIEENDFAWSGWENAEEAITEVKSFLSVVESGAIPERLDLAVMFAPTGPMQETSISSGWGDTFLKVAERWDNAERRMWA